MSKLFTVLIIMGFRVVLSTYYTEADYGVLNLYFLNFLTCKQSYWPFQNEIVNLFTMDKVCEAIKKMHRVTAERILERLGMQTSS